MSFWIEWEIFLNQLESHLIELESSLKFCIRIYIALQLFIMY